jgi:hypothetical protein
MATGSAPNCSRGAKPAPGRDTPSTSELRRSGPTVTTSFLDIGTPRDYLETALHLGVSESTGSPTVTRSIVWPSARVAEGARLDRVIVAGDAHVPAGLEVRDAVVVPARFARPDDVAATVHGDIAVFPFA